MRMPTGSSFRREDILAAHDLTRCGSLLRVWQRWLGKHQRSSAPAASGIRASHAVPCHRTGITHGPTCNSCFTIWFTRCARRRSLEGDWQLKLHCRDRCVCQQAALAGVVRETARARRDGTRHGARITRERDGGDRAQDRCAARSTRMCNAAQRDLTAGPERSCQRCAQVRTRRRSGARWLLRPPRPPRRTARRRVC